MAFLEGKSPSERKKIMLAAGLGVLAFASLWFAFGPNLTGGSTTKVTVSVSPTPRPAASPARELGPVSMPSRAEQDLGYMIPVDYRPGVFDAPPARRNIFAFYEPPPPCPECPTPTPIVTPMRIPTPTPPLPYEITGASPGSVYAGTKSFRLEVSGDRFTPDARIYLDNQEMPTTFINEQRLATNVPANFVASEGTKYIFVRSPDGSKYSQQRSISVQPPPKPNVKYIGMIARRLGNNDTAYLDEGKPTPTPYRLNDVVSGRFRLVNISSDRVVFEDVNLGFRHQVELFRPPPGTATSGTGSSPAGPRGFPSGMPQPMTPGMPDGIPRYTPPNRRNPNANTNPNQKPDVDDDDEPEIDNR